MSDKDRLILQVLQMAEKSGFTEIVPNELSNGGNLILHLAPYPIAARIGTAISKEDADLAYKILDRELRVACHLQSKGVPVLLPTDLTEAGPHNVGGIWMTLWKYAAPAQLQPLLPGEAVGMVGALSTAMKDFSGELPVLGVWERTFQAAFRLKEHQDRRIQALLNIFQGADQRMRLGSGQLIPCHGDAHAGNLLSSADGRIWTDFEDVSLMPAYWDLASFVCNLALFHGIQQPTFRYILEHIGNETDLKEFGFAVIARTLMSTLGNLDFALAGHGNLEFATKQLELAEDFILQAEQITGANAVVY